MAIDRILVTLGGLAAIVWNFWFFFFSKRERTTAQTDESGVQEVQVAVKGGYTPDVIVVKKGRPVRLAFHREETAACSDTVVFGDFGISKPLPAFKTTAVEFTPQESGEFTFTCGMGMLRGKLVVADV